MNEIYISGAGTLTLPQLEQYSGRIAAYLAERGIRAAAVISGKSPLVFAAIRGCIMAGVCYIPVDESLPEQRRRAVLDEADIVLYDGGDISGGAELADLREVIRRGSAEIGEMPPLYSETPAYRIYTSGTTGAPKGIEVTLGNAGSFLRWFMTIPAIEEEMPRRVLNQAMFSFDLSVADLYYSLFTGAALTVIERGLMRDFSGLFRRMSESRAQLAVFTPAFAELCMCDSSFNRELMPELRVIFFCGEVLKPETAAKLFRRFPGLRIVNAYGPTETCCAVTAAEITPDMTDEALPVGDMLHTAGEIRVIDGEIVIFGDSAARYTGAAGDSSGGFRRVDGRRCFFTGDSGYIKDGRLYFTGRIDRQLKIMGYRVEPEDIENNLLKIPGVLQAAVSVSGRRGSRQSTAALSASVRTEGGITPEEIRGRLSELVPWYMLPAKITITDNMPMSANGKLKREGLR